jgi:hypothetical protein
MHPLSETIMPRYAAAGQSGLLRRMGRGVSVWLLLLGVLFGSAAFAQTVTGNIGGTVTDTTGSVIPGAKVTATNVATNVSVATVSNKAGLYSIRFLQIGQYTVTVDAKGFAKSVYGPFTLEIDQVAKVDVSLKVGSQSETMTVSGALAPILNTDNSQIDTTFDENQIKNIPLNGQNFSQLMLYMPGAVSTQPTGMDGVGSVERNTGSSGQVSVNGNRLQTNNYLWDGVEVNETINNLIGYNPAPQAIAEMKVVSANPNAEYGNANGGDVIMEMKSGGNKFHGSVYGILQDSKLDANSWGNKHVAAGSPIAQPDKYTQSQFGGTIGGPILKNKLFFFADYSGDRFHDGSIQQLYVATAKMRTGDFSELLDPNIMCESGDTASGCQSKLIQLYDPVNNFAPYAGNLNVPINNPVAKYLYAHPELYPLPNHAPQPGSPVGENFFGASENYNRNDQGDLRIDWTPNDTDRLFFHYSQGEGNDGYSAYPVPVFFQSGSDYPDKIFVADDVHTFTPSLVNEIRGGYSRIRWIQGEPVDPSGVFGLKGDSVVGICSGCSQPFPGFASQNVNALNTPGNPAGGTAFIDNTFDYVDTMTWQHGKHNSKAGVELVRYQQNNFYPGNDGALGQFHYNGNYTSNPNVGAPGYSVADFVLDRVQFEGIGSVAGRTGQRQWRTAYFVQDDWHATPNLTLNLGLRYEFDQPIYEVNNKEASVNFATGQAILAGVNGNSRALYNPTHNNLMPRIGFAYQATNRFVVRGGYGITTFLEGTGANLRLTYNPPFQPSLEITGSAPTTTSPGTFFKVENGFSTSSVPNYSGTTYRAWDPNLKPAFISTYSMSTQYQINNQSSFTAAYVGESGAHLIQAVAANQLHSACVISGVIQSDPSSAACAASDPAPFQALVGQTGGVVETASEGMYNYNALQTSYHQRPLNGLEFTVNYTYGRAMTNTDGFFGVPNINGPSPYAENAYNNHEEYGPVGQDIRNNLSGTAVYDLPFGRGRRYGTNLNPIVDRAVGGWKVSMTASAYSGFPATPYTDYNYAGTENKAIRPNVLIKVPVIHRDTNHWFGTDARLFAQCTAPGQTESVPAGGGAAVPCAYGSAPIGQYGDAAPNSLRGPGYQNYDLSLSKDFPIIEKQLVAFRVDAFNALNHASLNNPDTDTTDGSYGKITGVRSQERRYQFSASYQF